MQSTLLNNGTVFWKMVCYVSYEMDVEAFEYICAKIDIKIVLIVCHPLSDDIPFCHHGSSGGISEEELK